MLAACPVCGNEVCVRAQSLSRIRLFCDPVDCSPARLLCPWDSPGEDTGVGCYSPSSGESPQPRDRTRLFPLLHCRQILYRLTEFLATPHKNVRLEWLVTLIQGASLQNLDRGGKWNSKHSQARLGFSGKNALFHFCSTVPSECPKEHFFIQHARYPARGSLVPAMQETGFHPWVGKIL